ncbi:MAG: cytochrome-c peroxidase, partial [Bacteroidota bacterium]
MKNLILFSFALILLTSCETKKKEVKKDGAEDKPALTELQTQAKGLFGELPLIAENEANPVTDEKVALGKALYFDTILSKNGTQSCNSCHNLDTYGV